VSSATPFLKNTRIIAALTLASRVLGLGREMVFAYCFSTGSVLSAFRLAFVVPNLARRLFGEGALSSALIPILSETITKEGENAGRRLAGSVMTLIFVGLTGVVVVVELGVAVARWMNPELALDLTAVLLPYMVLVCATAVAGGVLNVRGRFAVPAATPMILNVAIIAGAGVGARWAGRGGEALMYVVCVSVLVAGAVQLALQLVTLYRDRFFPILNLEWRGRELRRVFAMMGPMILGLSAVQISTLTDYLIAYIFVTDAAGQRVGPAVLGYAQYLYQLPLGVFGIALATAVFPAMAARAAEDDLRGLEEIFVRGVRMTFFIGLPASVGLIFVARPLVCALFQRGDFDAGDTSRVAGALTCYAVGLAAYFTNHVVVRTFYSLKDSKTPVRIAAWMVLLNVSLGLVLVFTPLQEWGLALATAVSAVCQTVWLAISLRRVLPHTPTRLIATGLKRTLLATALMALVLTVIATLPLLRDALADRAVGRLIVLVVAGVASYASSARLLGMEELDDLVGLRRKK